MGPNNCLPADSDMDHFIHLLGFKYQSILLPEFEPMAFLLPSPCLGINFLSGICMALRKKSEVI